MSTILVIEDTQDNFDLIADALEDTHNVLHANNGRDGLTEAHRLKPDLILLDMVLPEMDGWEVVRRLKADSDLASIPVIALTAQAMKDDRAECLAAGCDDYIAKPIKVRALLSLIDRHASCEKVRGQR